MVFSGSKDVASHRCIEVFKNKSVALFGLLDVSDDGKNCTTNLSCHAVLGKIARSLQNAVEPGSMASERHVFFFFFFFSIIPVTIPERLQVQCCRHPGWSSLLIYSVIRSEGGLSVKAYATCHLCSVANGGK